MDTFPHFNLEAYLARIAYDVTRLPTVWDAAALADLMRCQLFSVVFENLDVQRGRGVSLAHEDIYHKIVHDNRGGYCYEVNGLFAQALHALGLSYQYVAARPMFYPMLRPKTHMALVVKLPEGLFLCDLGFGSYGIRAPLALHALNQVVEQDFDRFMLTCDQTSADAYAEYTVQAEVDGVWIKQYAFNLSPQLWVDFMPANYVNSTHPEAIFVQKRVLIKHSSEGRDILLGNRYKQIRATGVVEYEVEESQATDLIIDVFGLEV